MAKTAAHMTPPNTPPALTKFKEVVCRASARSFEADLPKISGTKDWAVSDRESATGVRQ